MTGHSPRSPQAPLSIRLIVAADGLARRVLMALEELALAVVPPSQRESINAFIYARASAYKPDGYIFETGLFSWEAEALRHPAFPQSGRLLVGGVGAGRETEALAGLGYSVVGFEPSDLVDIAVQLAAGRPTTRIVRASYSDLVDAVQSGRGPLAAELPKDTPFDGIILGWASFSHVLLDDERRALLEATRRLAPGAPLLLSYLPGPNPPVSGGRKRLRDTLQRLGAPGRPGPGDRFQAADGYHRRTDDSEIQELAAATGYEIVFQARVPYGHALLRPRPDGSGP